MVKHLNSMHEITNSILIGCNLDKKIKVKSLITYPTIILLSYTKKKCLFFRFIWYINHSINLKNKLFIKIVSD
jgi:hypothetical protein